MLRKWEGFTSMNSNPKSLLSVCKCVFTCVCLCVCADMFVCVCTHVHACASSERAKH